MKVIASNESSSLGTCFFLVFSELDDRNERGLGPALMTVSTCSLEEPSNESTLL